MKFQMSTNFSDNKLITSKSLIFSLVVTFLLTGCSKINNPNIEKEHTSTTEVLSSPMNEIQTNLNNSGSSESSRIEQCAKELDALKTTNPKNFEKSQLQFEQMIATINRYSQVRSSIKSQTQDTVEALYTYKVSRICNNIEQYLLEGLTDAVILKNEGGHK